VQNCQILEIIDVPWLFAATEIRVQIGTDFQTEFEKDQVIGKAKMSERKEKEKKEENRRKRPPEAGGRMGRDERGEERKRPFGRRATARGGLDDTGVRDLGG
jgi:hypothetical protein